MDDPFVYDWTRFVRRIPVTAERQAIYDAWATRKGLESWFLRKAEFRAPNGKALDGLQFAKAGDNYEWLWHGWSDDVVERGEVLEADGKDHFRFSFGKAGIVDVEIKTEGKETIVELTQESIPTDEPSKAMFHLGCSTGWTFYLANLKSILEGGLDLRNKNENLKNLVNS